MPHDTTEVLAGDCTVRFEGEEIREERGAVVVIEKPDGTVIVHDREGYRPVAWLTRADSVSWPASGRIEARKDDQRLRVTCHAEYGAGRFRTTRAGAPVGDCPDGGGSLVRERGAVACIDCGDRYSIPRDAAVIDSTCDCGLPRMHVERGGGFEVCVDRACESLDDRVRERFDRKWTCPACDGDLRILRRGGLIAGCENYPDCETGYALPAGVLDGVCDCGLPEFRVSDDTRCLDATCSR